MLFSASLCGVNQQSALNWLKCNAGYSDSVFRGRSLGSLQAAQFTQSISCADRGKRCLKIHRIFQFSLQDTTTELPNGCVVIADIRPIRVGSFQSP